MRMGSCVAKRQLLKIGSINSAAVFTCMRPDSKDSTWSLACVGKLLSYYNPAQIFCLHPEMESH